MIERGSLRLGASEFRQPLEASLKNRVLHVADLRQPLTPIFKSNIPILCYGFLGLDITSPLRPKTEHDGVSQAAEPCYETRINYN